jgi:hypothetical protein
VVSVLLAVGAPLEARDPVLYELVVSGLAEECLIVCSLNVLLFTMLVVKVK